MKNYSLIVLLLVSLFSFSQEKKWSLQECVTYALENNISVKQSELDKATALENVKTARGNFLPNLNGSASQNFNFGSYIDQDGGRVAIDTRGNGFSLSTGVTVFNGFRNTNTYKQSKLGVASSELQLEVLMNNISLSVANSYLNVLFNKENLRVAQERINFSKQQLEQMEEFVSAGVRARADLLELEAQLASDQENLVRSENSVDLSLLGLAQLLQISPDGFDVAAFETQLEILELLYNNPSELFNKAVEDRPEIELANIDIENTVFNTKIAKGAYMPILSFGASMSTSYQHRQGQEDVREIFDSSTPDPFDTRTVPNGFGTQLEDNLGYSVGFSLTIPVFNRFQTKANVARAKINEDKGMLRLAQAKQDLRSNIESAYTDAKAALKQYQSSEASLNSQLLAFDNAKERYDLGSITLFDFEQVRNRLLNAQSALINAKYNFIFKTKVLDFYAGKSILN